MRIKRAGRLAVSVEGEQEARKGDALLLERLELDEARTIMEIGIGAGTTMRMDSVERSLRRDDSAGKGRDARIAALTTPI